MCDRFDLGSIRGYKPNNWLIAKIARIRAERKAMAMKNVPEGVIGRLSTYLNCLIKLQQENIKTVSSETLGNACEVNPAEVRRDLAHFGSFGKKGVGYDVETLTSKVRHILGSDEPHKIALVGVGNLGAAIMHYQGLPLHGFHVAAIFDSDPEKIGKRVGNQEVIDIKDLPRVVRGSDIDIGIIAVPPAAAQEVADLLVEGKVSVIVNYTPALIKAPQDVQLHNTDPVRQLLHTLYYLSDKHFPKRSSRVFSGRRGTEKV